MSSVFEIMDLFFFKYNEPFLGKLTRFNLESTSIFCDVTLCSLVDIYKRFEGLISSTRESKAARKMLSLS
jgi:hypothetical protein